MSASLELLSEVQARELAPLVGIEDQRLGESLQGLPQGGHTKIRLQGVGQAPAEHLAAGPVHMIATR